MRTFFPPKSRRRLTVLLAVLAAPVIWVAVLAGSATGATVTAQGPHATYSWFQLKSADYLDSCIAEQGTSSSIAGVACSSNHSDYWRWTSGGELLNEHSGKCLSVTGSDPGVYVNTCANNHAQLWNTQSIDVFAGGTLYLYDEFVNVHTGLPLGLLLGTTVVQESAGDTLWHLT